MVKCTCVRCYKDFVTPMPSWWCDDCKMAEFEKRQKKKPATNGDRIRAMSDEELAKHLADDIGWDCTLCSEHERLENEPLLRCEKCDEKCVEHCLEWLKRSVGEDAHE